MNIQQDVSLKSLNTLSVESRANYLVQVQSLNEALEAITYAQSHNLTIQVLGGGSNVVLPEVVSSLVLQYVGSGYVILEENEQSVSVRVEAGFNWHDWVMLSLEKGWYGLQNLALIPGHVGAAPVQNIGAYGVEVKESIDQVHGVYLDSGEVFVLSNKECHFAYRESIFKQALNNNVLITHVDFSLSKEVLVNVSYAPLDKMAATQGNPSPFQLAQWVIEVRNSKLPLPDDLPNAGSFFKNPVITLKAFDELFKRFPNIPNYKQVDCVKVSAGWLIDQLGLKGKYFGPVRVHEKQALVLINQGGSGADVIQAARQIQNKVKEHYGIELEQEPRIVV